MELALRERETLRELAAEPLVGLGAGRALLMQLAHPKVAQGVAEHSDFAGRPLARLFGTLDFLLIVTFGTEEEVERFSRRIRGLHRGLKGEGYTGADPELQMWVNATLIDSALYVYERVMRPDEDEVNIAAEYYRQARIVGEVLDVPEGMQPADLEGFRAYVDRMVEELVVTEQAREVARAVLWPKRLRWLGPGLAIFRLLTAAMLPASLREQFGLPWSHGRQRVADLFLRTGTDLYHVTPRWLRRPPERFLVWLAKRRVNATMRHRRR
ncbi:oxygenase MpaB family protein [Spirillospora sp. NPDC047279]|uniref:oxygenase MpaB family protein n=1 Tax=Spirillospora sp. NPDC047279 TaxID=3155478 RepID=UPI0033FC1ACB